MAFAFIAGGGVISIVGHQGFLQQASHTLQIRLAIWQFGWESAIHHPLIGLGFGGWLLAWPQYASQIGLSPTLPPHNTLLIGLAESGFPALVLSATMIVSILGLGVRALSSWDKRVAAFGLALLGGYGWVHAYPVDAQ